MPRLRLSQEWQDSTTQRRAFQPGTRAFNLISSGIESGLTHKRPVVGLVPHPALGLSYRRWRVTLRGMSSSRLSWLVAVPLMVAGSFAARAASYVCLPQNGGETGNEAAEHVQAGARGVQWPLALGVVAALVCVALVLQVIRLVSDRQARPVSAWAFFWLPPLAFVGQEIVERVMQGGVDLGPGVLSHAAVGLALQLPFALVALALAFLLLAAATRIAETIRAERPVSRLAIAPVQALLDRCELPARWLFPRGHPQRGPPITTS